MLLGLTRHAKLVLTPTNHNINDININDNGNNGIIKKM